MRRVWYKCALTLAAGVVFGLGLGGGCLTTSLQRILVAVAFD